MKKILSGKVRDVYEVNDKELVIVTTDRISAFDVILNSTIKNKGIALNQLSLYWFDYTSDIIPNHIISSKLSDMPAYFPENAKEYEKRTVLVALHKLGIPIGLPSDEAFNIRKIYFVDTIIDEEAIEDIILQVNKGYCDNLFYLDTDKHFTANYALFALRNAAKKYITEVLAKSTLDVSQNIMSSPISWENLFSLGELKSIMVFKDQVNIPLNFDERGNPRKEKMESLLKEIELGLWDIYLMWNFEAYQNAKNQLQLGRLFINLPINTQTPTNIEQTNSE